LSNLDPPTEGVHHRGTGLLLVAVAATIWSTGGLIVRSLDVADSWTISFWRSLFASIFLTGYVVVQGRRSSLASLRQIGWPGVVVGACFATASLGFVLALGLTSVANTVIILASAPFVAALLAWLLLGESIGGRTWLAMLVTIVGLGVMVQGSAGRRSLAGDLIALAIPAAFALATVIIRRQRHVRMSPAMLVGTLIGLSVSALFAGDLAVSGHDLLLLVVFGAFQLGTGMAIYVVGARMAPSAEVTLVSLLETVLGPLWVWLFADEQPGRSAMIGGSLVLVALVTNAAFDLRRA
jgi:drug/metabolite transporter (DMT)-like permease